MIIFSVINKQQSEKAKINKYRSEEERTKIKLNK